MNLINVKDGKCQIFNSDIQLIHSFKLNHLGMSNFLYCLQNKLKPDDILVGFDVETMKAGLIAQCIIWGRIDLLSNIDNMTTFNID